MNNFKLKVPATTANMGPGFDTIGMALRLYNEYEIERISNGIEFIGNREIPIEENLVYMALQETFRRRAYKPEGIRIHAKEIAIPVSRGLGSSAASIVAGIMIANEIMDSPMTKSDIIQIGTELEGHPDNIVPAVVGGLTVSIYKDRKVVYSSISIPDHLRFAVMIPDFVVSTNEARKVLPVQYDRGDCIFNISRVAMLVAAMSNGEVEKLRLAMEDKIHEPYRGRLIPDLEKIFAHAKNLGAIAEVISGSGSTLLAVVDEKNLSFEAEMKKYLGSLQDKWDLRILETDMEGVRVL